ncbi:hypothetical protein DSO57_1011896 [Entomophthora muscae]|uniref:Uncharacterized protein n=1 Tax=Entomophthora muscae TaxID=34485 RepID=A0ACC2TU89_9FUNG|nr:hypothetical protein DSO57_1011896 [Entomophthora muscae]
MIGLVANAVLLACNYGRWSIDGILITINALIDCIIGANAILSTWFRIQYPSALNDNSLWCHVTFVIERALSIACLNVVMLLALVRYFVIVRKTNSNPRVWTCAALSLVLALLVMVGVRSKDAKLHVYPSGMYCYTFYSQLDDINKVFYLIFPLFYVPHLAIIPFCYFRISCYYHQLIQTTEFVITTRLWRKIMGLAIVVLVYWVSIIPHIFLVHIAASTKHMPSPTWDKVFYCLKISFILINAMFPIMFQAEIQDNFKQLFSSKNECNVFIRCH